MKRFIFILLAMSIGVSCLAQVVTGTVLDDKGMSVIGAGVQLKGSPSVGAVTDIDGKFSLKVNDVSTDRLVVSCVGYKTKHQPLNGKSSVTITLELDQRLLDEVVVIGYGTSKKSDLTGAVASVETTDEEAARSTSFDKMLQGKVAGVSVSTGSAAPGGSVNVRIRGISSLRGDNTPLYVIDGNIVSQLGDTMNPMSQGSQSGNSRQEPQDPLSGISPQDIESIEILKDASATAIYGSQGANGVVLITTKQGKSARPAIMFSANTTVSVLAEEIGMLDAEEYINFRNSPELNGGAAGKMTMDGVIPVDWQKECTRTAISRNYRASVSGKANTTAYYLAGGYADQQGVIDKTNLKKYDFRVNLEQGIGKLMTLKSNTSYSSVTTAMTSGTDKLANTRSSIVRHMISFKPYRGVEDDYSEYDETVTSPDAWFSDYDDDSKDNTFNTNISLDIKPLSWLTIHLKGGLVNKNKTRSIWFGTQTFVGSSTNGKAGLSTLSTTSYNTEALLLFDYKVGKHSFSGTAGVVYDNKKLSQTSYTGENFFTEDLRADGIAGASVQYPIQYKKTGERLFSSLARAVYNYGQRYILTATFRADGSSNFDPSNRFSYFPSFAAAWRVNKEKWMRNSNNINNLKIRAGWGQVGNQAISPYQTMASYTIASATGADGSLQSAIVPGLIANKDLKWEISEQYNIGVDLGTFNDRFTFTVDWYDKNTKDLLQQIALPYSSGFENMWINNGEIRNRGLEFSLSAAPVSTRDWYWNIGANLSFERSKILSMDMEKADFGSLKGEVGYYGENLGNNTYTKFPANVFMVGHPVGMFLGYKTDGIMQEEEYYSIENQKNPVSINGSDILPGDVNYVDTDKNGVIDDNDKVIIGDPHPDLSYAFNSTLSYKNWNMEASFTGVYGNDIINANLIDELDVKNYNNNVRTAAYRNAWTVDNRSDSYPRLGYEQKGVLTDRIIEDGSYLKLSYVTLSYMFKLKKSDTIKSLTLSATGSNLFTITSYSGYDPDINTFSNDVDRLGIDLVSYPSARHFTFGLIANF